MLQYVIWTALEAEGFGAKYVRMPKSRRLR